MAIVPIEDRLAIQELVNAYPLYCDTHQFDKTCDLFTEDCIFDETAVGARLVNSRDDMKAIFREAGDRLGPFMHICTNHVISEFSGNTAAGMCHVVAEGVFNIDGEGKPFRLFGYYDDKYEKVNGQWYYKARALRLLVPSQGSGSNAGGIDYKSAAKHYGFRSK
jgi:hypothetical protein